VCVRVRAGKRVLPGQELLGGTKEEGGCAVISSLVSFFFFIFVIFSLHGYTCCCVCGYAREDPKDIFNGDLPLVHVPHSLLLLLPCYIYPLVVFRFS
jgi:hypothetical protein